MKRTSRGARLLSTLAATAVIGACGTAPQPSMSASQPSTSSAGAETTRPVTPTSDPTPALAVPESLTDPALDLRSPPVEIPLRLEIPSLEVVTPILAVGITASNIMDAPTGAADDPVWHHAFWYRGGSVPGRAGTATVAGHATDSRGRPATFARLDVVRPGAAVTIRDLRTDTTVEFVVTSTASYTLEEATRRPILEQIYGTGPVAGTLPHASADGLAHLTLITCSGTFDRGLGTHDHRLVVYATRVA